MSSEKQIIYFHYHHSPFAKRIVWYLHLRNIPYIQCLQPIVLPRPDINNLGIHYRRIPLLSIGRTIYLDTRAIILALERLFPPSPAHPSISATSPEHLTIQRLLSKWIIDGPIFMRSSQLIPTTMPTLNDPTFISDREQMTGRPWTKSSIERTRPEATADIKAAFSLLETSILSDNRTWLLNTPSPSLSDIEAIWPFVWLTSMPGALDPQQISPSHFPLVFAWIKRFLTAVKPTPSSKPKSIKGPEALQIISTSSWLEDVEAAKGDDASGLKKGQKVEVWPTDSGFNNRDVGILVALNEREIVWETKTKEGESVHVHAPRQGFRIRAVGEGGKSAAKL